MSKFYISEENLGPEATQEQAEALAGYMCEEGFDCEYGNSINNVVDNEEDQYAFDHVFYTLLGKI